MRRVIKFLVDGERAFGKRNAAKKCCCAYQTIVRRMEQYGREFVINGRRIIVLTPYPEWIKSVKQLHENYKSCIKKSSKTFRENHRLEIRKQKNEFYRLHIDSEREKARIRYHKRQARKKMLSELS